MAEPRKQDGNTPPKPEQLPDQPGDTPHGRRTPPADMTPDEMTSFEDDVVHGERSGSEVPPPPPPD